MGESTGSGVGVSVGVTVGPVVGSGVGVGVGVAVDVGRGKMCGNGGIVGITVGKDGIAGTVGTAGTSGSPDCVLTALTSTAMVPEMASAMAHIVRITIIISFFMVPPPQALGTGLHSYGMSFMPYNLAGSSDSARLLGIYGAGAAFT